MGQYVILDSSASVFTRLIKINLTTFNNHIYNVDRPDQFVFDEQDEQCCQRYKTRSEANDT